MINTVGDLDGREAVAAVDEMETDHISDVNAERINYVFSCMVGQMVVVHLSSGICIEGIFHAYSANHPTRQSKGATHSGSFILKCARQLATEEKRSSEIWPILGLNANDVITLVATNCPLDFTEAEEVLLARESERLKTDAEIAGGGAVDERELERWCGLQDVTEVDTAVDFKCLLGDGEGSWDQFEVNRRKFNVGSTYAEDIYTTPLNLDTIPAPLKMQAERLAAEMERNSLSNDPDRGADSGLDEEALYGAVRGTGAYTDEAETRGNAGGARKKPLINSANRSIKYGNGRNSSQRENSMAGDLLILAESRAGHDSGDGAGGRMPKTRAGSKERFHDVTGRTHASSSTRVASHSGAMLHSQGSGFDPRLSTAKQQSLVHVWSSSNVAGKQSGDFIERPNQSSVTKSHIVSEMKLLQGLNALNLEPALPKIADHTRLHLCDVAASLKHKTKAAVNRGDRQTDKREFVAWRTMYGGRMKKLGIKPIGKDVVGPASAADDIEGSDEDDRPLLKGSQSCELSKARTANGSALPTTAFGSFQFNPYASAFTPSTPSNAKGGVAVQTRTTAVSQIRNVNSTHQPIQKHENENLQTGMATATGLTANSSAVPYAIAAEEPHMMHMTSDRPTGHSCDTSGFSMSNRDNACSGLLSNGATPNNETELNDQHMVCDLSDQSPRDHVQGQTSGATRPWPAVLHTTGILTKTPTEEDGESQYVTTSTEFAASQPEKARGVYTLPLTLSMAESVKDEDPALVAPHWPDTSTASYRDIMGHVPVHQFTGPYGEDEAVRTVTPNTAVDVGGFSAAVPHVNAATGPYASFPISTAMIGSGQQLFLTPQSVLVHATGQPFNATAMPGHFAVHPPFRGVQRRPFVLRSPAPGFAAYHPVCTDIPGQPPAMFTSFPGFVPNHAMITPQEYFSFIPGINGFQHQTEILQDLGAHEVAKQGISNTNSSGCNVPVNQDTFNTTSLPSVDPIPPTQSPPNRTNMNFAPRPDGSSPQTAPSGATAPSEFQREVDAVNSRASENIQSLGSVGPTHFAYGNPPNVVITPGRMANVVIPQIHSQQGYFFGQQQMSRPSNISALIPFSALPTSSNGMRPNTSFHYSAVRPVEGSHRNYPLVPSEAQMTTAVIPHYPSTRYVQPNQGLAAVGISASTDGQIPAATDIAGMGQQLGFAGAQAASAYPPLSALQHPRIQHPRGHLVQSDSTTTSVASPVSRPRSVSNYTALPPHATQQQIAANSSIKVATSNMSGVDGVPSHRSDGRLGSLAVMAGASPSTDYCTQIDPTAGINPKAPQSAVSITPQTAAVHSPYIAAGVSESYAEALQYNGPVSSVGYTDQAYMPYPTHMGVAHMGDFSQGAGGTFRPYVLNQPRGRGS